MATKKISLNEFRDIVKKIIKEEKGNVYSSDNMFEVKISDLNNKLLATKKIRAKNSREAKEIFEDDYLDNLKEKHGTDLRYKINLAENKINRKTIKEENESYGSYFEVEYYNYGQRYTERFTREEAKKELLNYGYSKKEVDKMSDEIVGKLLRNMYNP